MSGVTVSVAGDTECSCAVVKRDAVMLENMREMQHHAQARYIYIANLTRYAAGQSTDAQVCCGLGLLTIH